LDAPIKHSASHVVDRQTATPLRQLDHNTQSANTVLPSAVTSKLVNFLKLLEKIYIDYNYRDKISINTCFGGYLLIRRNPIRRIPIRRNPNVSRSYASDPAAVDVLITTA
jgi:hypothetical protein